MFRMDKNFHSMVGIECDIILDHKHVDNKYMKGHKYVDDTVPKCAGKMNDAYYNAYVEQHENDGVEPTIHKVLLTEGIKRL